jgi:c-di-AMP phosphodiesterase-like protein
MVTELVQYLPSGPVISRVDAEALMSGIMLDTKNFVMRTGVRTFEAAAWLRRLGADTVEVRKLFASSIESYQRKAALISTADIYKSCAIASLDETFDDIKIVAPQAADDMMSISGVSASFVIFIFEDIVNVSARSMGAVNVQLIMEKLGGGGHHAMAAAQIEGGDIGEVRDRLTKAIDSYWEDVAPALR